MATSYDTWKLGLNGPHFDDGFDYDNFEGLPYRLDSKLRRYRDRETGEFVKTYLAEIKNDEECERQVEAEYEASTDDWREDY